MTSTSGPGISLMSEFAGLAYYAEVPGVVFDIQRVGPSTGLADPHGAGRHPSSRDALARRYQTDHADPGVGRGVLHDGDGRLRSRRALPDARVRHERPRSRHEHLDVARRSRIPMHRSIAASSWMRTTVQRARRMGPLSRRRWRRHPVPDDSRHRRARVFHARIGPQRKRDSTANARTTTSQHGTARAQIRHRPRLRAEADRCRRRRRRHRRSSDTAAATGRSRRAGISSRAKRASTAYMRLRAYPFTEELEAFIDHHQRIYVVEQNRDAQMLQPDAAGAQRRTRSPSSARCCTTTDCRSTPGRSPTRFWRRRAIERARVSETRDGRAARAGAMRRRARPRASASGGGAPQQMKDHGDDTEPAKKTNRIGLEHAAVSRRQDDALRGVRPQRHLRAHHRRVLRNGDRSESRSSSFRGSAVRARVPRISSAPHTGSTASTAGCRRSARARSSRTGS